MACVRHLPLYRKSARHAFVKTLMALHRSGNKSHCFTSFIRRSFRRILLLRLVDFVRGLQTAPGPLLAEWRRFIRQLFPVVTANRQSRKRLKNFMLKFLAYVQCRRSSTKAREIAKR